MKITYIISDIDKAVFFENTAISLRNEGYSLQFILINCENGALYHFLMNHSFEVVTIKCASLLKSWIAINSSRQALKNFQPKLIHCHLATANWVGLWAGKLAGIQKRIFTRHSGKPLKTHWKEIVIDKTQNYLATDIVAISQMIAELLQKQGVTSTKIKVIHHGFDSEAFQNISEEEKERMISLYNPAQKFPVVGVVSRWLELKGIDYTILAYQKLLECYPNALLCLFGGNKNGDYFEQINEHLKKLPVGSYRTVEYEKNVFGLYSLFDVYVHVPINQTCEAFGQTYIEALAAGCPSVFTLSGVASEFIEDKKNALVVPFKDANAIFDGLQKLIEDKALRQQLAEAGKESVIRFSMENYINQLVILYNA